MPRAGTCARAHRPDSAAPDRDPGKGGTAQDRRSPGSGSSNQQSVVSSSCHADTSPIVRRPDAGRRPGLRLRPRPGGRPRLFGLIARLSQISQSPRPPSENQLSATQPAHPTRMPRRGPGPPWTGRGPGPGTDPGASRARTSGRTGERTGAAPGADGRGTGREPGPGPPRSSSAALASPSLTGHWAPSSATTTIDIVVHLTTTMSHRDGYRRGGGAARPARRGKHERRGTPGA